MTNTLSVNHLIGIEDITADDIELIFSTADNFKDVINRPIKKVPSLRDITVANIFFENSTRTRLSFELAEKRLSADTVNFNASSSSVSKGETLIDTVNNILAMKVDMVVMRHPKPGAPYFLSQHVKANIINAGDGAHEHPTQALLDAFSIREKSVLPPPGRFQRQQNFPIWLRLLPKIKAYGPVHRKPQNCDKPELPVELIRGYVSESKSMARKLLLRLPIVVSIRCCLTLRGCAKYLQQ